MKKVTILSVIAVAAGLASCTAQAPKANLKTDVDTLAYSLGVSNTTGLKDYLSQRAGVGTTYMNAFIDGLLDGVNKKGEKDVAYMTGQQIGQQISRQMLPGMSQEIFGEEGMISQDNFVAGFIDAINGKTAISPVEARAFADTQVEAIKNRTLAEKRGEYKAENEKFLEENKSKEGVITTESGLQYKVITEGKGAIPENTDRVKVNYKGTLIDGTEFDSSYSRNEPATFRANQVIKGWTEALTMMPVGSKWELYIPQDLAYSSSDTGKIPPFSTLIFEVELVEIVK